MSAAGTPRARRALVLGAGVAGLAAARALADHVDEVVIVERDALPDGPHLRPGTPQARHIHNLLLRGLHDLEALFPGFAAELAAQGGVRVDLTRDMRFHSIWGWFPSYASDLQACLASRALIEHVLREQVRALPQVRWLERHRGVALLGDARRVHGLRCERDAAGAVGLEADLVLDASGRGTKLPAWLEALLGVATPFTEVDAGLAYATRLYRMPHAAPDWKILLVRDRAPSSRAGGIMPLEGGRWIATLAGFAGDHPPIDAAGFRDFARSLTAPEFADALDAAEPLGDAIGYRQTRNLWRHYERLARWPAGLAALGDAVCSLNPIYGHGMSVAAIEATLLRRQLAQHGATPALGDTLRTRLAAALAAPWSMSTSEDYRYPSTRGAPRTAAMRLRHRLGDAIARAAMHDREVHYRWLRVAHLVDPPSALLRPDLLWRSLRSHRGAG